MAKIDAPPLIRFYGDFTDADIKNVKKQAYWGRSTTGDRTVNLLIDDGTYSLEFQIEQTTRSYKELLNLLEFDDAQMFTEFPRCLSGATLDA